jgi:hypothetical protein
MKKYWRKPKRKEGSFSEQGENDMGEVPGDDNGTYCAREIVSGWGNFVILRGVEKINEMEMDFGELRGSRQYV